jgi:hypothetical protein
MRLPFLKPTFEITIIACGDTGQEIGAEILRTLEEFGKKAHHSLAINSGKRAHGTDKLYKEKLSISEESEGFARNLDKAIKSAAKFEKQLSDILKRAIPKENGITLICTGAGGTGIAATLLAVKTIKKQFKLTPPILTLIPEVFENSRTQYNIAEFIYQVVYSKNALGNPVILLDNKPTQLENNKPFEVVARKRIEKVPIGIANLLLSTFLKPSYQEFDAGFRDLMEVMNSSGIGVLVCEELGDEDGNLVSTRFIDILGDAVEHTTKLPKEKVFQARKVFCSIIDVDMETFQFNLEANKFITSFSSNSPYLIFVDSQAEDKKVTRPTLNALITGLPLPPRIIQLFQIARDSRKNVLIREHELQREIIDLKLDDVMKLEDDLINNY